MIIFGPPELEDFLIGCDCDLDDLSTSLSHALNHNLLYHLFHLKWDHNFHSEHHATSKKT